MNTAYVQSTLLGWIIPLAICISVWLRRNKDLRQKLFVLFAGNISLYYFFSFLHGFSFIQGWPGEVWFERIALGVAVLIPQGGLRFFRAFSTGAHGMGRLGGMAAFLGVILIAAIIYPSSLRPGIGPAVLVYVGGFMLVAILNLNVQVKTVTTRIDAARIRYLVIGGFITLSFLVVDRLDQIFDFHVPPFGLAMTIIYLYVISQAITRYRMLDLYEMIGRFAVLTLMGIALAGIYTGLIFWVGAGISMVSAFLASLVILILFDPLRELVERKISDFFLRERRILEQDIAQIRRRLAHVIDVDAMINVILSGFDNSRRITHAALYLIDPHGRGFDLRGSVGDKPEMTRIEIADAKKHLKISSSGGAYLSASLAARQERLLQAGDRDKAEAIGESIDLLKELRADALLTIEGEDQLFGFMSISDKRLNDPFSPEDLSLLKGLAGQVASTVENSRIYQQTKERDRLASLGQMAAGLAHEIRNPLGSLKGAAQVIEDMTQSPSGTSDKELLGVIVEEVDRLNRVVSDFLTYARPSLGQPRIIDANTILKRTLQLFETGHEHQMDITTDLVTDLPGCEIDGEQLHQVFLNLILNSYQAMENQSYRRLEITTRERIVRSIDDTSSKTSNMSRYAEIRFADNGPGIEPKILENIFIPFFTTKQKGSGLGLSVCQRIVRDAGGEIEVRSQTGYGSIFTVVLPACDTLEE